eukprot:gnl/MRDRNA2_/MRDRNA2_102624_c0_seq1.p1 gnl/MRDRNA2_/MRDRNA2_102624_c0~~gnl/MRDRNA2_/MRDRNA2_102624_c0_seq1.p1  ORF type:complete len:1088 (+),score=229.01 gnl/MRDRNA2_/MRDRNA2_102624_c0_seq1:63-3326(+)
MKPRHSMTMLRHIQQLRNPLRLVQAPWNGDRPLAKAAGIRFFAAPAAKKGAKSPAKEEEIVFGANELHLESIYGLWKVDSSQVDPVWTPYFEALEQGQPAALPMGGKRLRKASLSARIAAESAKGSAVAPVASAPAAAPSGDSINAQALSHMIRAFQIRGHEVANLDPLGLFAWKKNPARPPELDPEFYGFQDSDYAKKLKTKTTRSSVGGASGLLASMDAPLLGKSTGTLGDLIANLNAVYCGTLGIEYMHMADRKKCNWWRDRLEDPDFLYLDPKKAVKTFERICDADSFEQYLGKNFKTTKRFGLDGGESVVPGLKALIDKAADMGCQEFVIGMPHRGRLNVLVNVLGKPMPQMFAEFKGTHYDLDKILAELETEDWSASGDVKYHLGTSNERKYPDGKVVRLSLEANPSHLETVDPITVGRVKAKQFYMGNTDECMKKVMPILMHGDAAFAGQGVVYETMQLAGVEDFAVGGTVHVIVNNQVGFTTDPKNSRTSTYCSDLGKGFNIPILHCNGDDVHAVVRAFELAAEWRQEWGTDVIVDLICYRRFGHNEIDNPDFTQPNLYKAISKHPRSENITADHLIKSGIAMPEKIEEIRNKIAQQLEDDLKASEDWVPQGVESWVCTHWPGFEVGGLKAASPPKVTGVDKEILSKIGQKLCEVPSTFTIHPQLGRIIDAKRQRVTEGADLDWGTCEALAWGTLLLEGTHVRIAGQDVERGTFSHRHCFLRDQKDNSRFSFLQNLAPDLGSQAEFTARNSALSEYAVLGFELGYSYENPNTLNIWEAQFGDFANTAQVITDQYLSAGEHKWHQQTALTVLLPHGYDGQGAEHSSCRLERFLQMCDDDEDDIPAIKEAGSFSKQVQNANWQVCNISTPANYFHALRRQIHRDYRKPLIVAAPKNLLRLKTCVSTFDDMGPGTMFQRVISERNPNIKPENVTRLVFCTGKIYYELAAERDNAELTHIAIVSVEQIAPFPFDRIIEEMEKYPNVDHGDGIHPGDVVWCQEEPKNMGSWTYVKPRLVTAAREGLDKDTVPFYAGRRAAASPATGLAKLHTMEQNAVVQEGLTGQDILGDVRDRSSALLGHHT